MGVTATLLVHRIHGLPADRDIEHAEHLASNRPRLTLQRAMSRIRVSRTSRGHARPTTDKASSRAFVHGIPDIVNRRAGFERDVRAPVSLPPSERTARLRRSGHVFPANCDIAPPVRAIHALADALGVGEPA